MKQEQKQGLFSGEEGTHHHSHHHPQSHHSHHHHHQQAGNAEQNVMRHDMSLRQEEMKMLMTLPDIPDFPGDEGADEGDQVPESD